MVETPFAWQDQDLQASRAPRIFRAAETAEAPVSAKEPPGLRIEPTSDDESIFDKSDHDTVSIYSNSTTPRDLNDPANSEKLHSSALHLKVVFADEKRNYDGSYDRESVRSSKGSMSIPSTMESDIQYPSTPRVLFVTLSLAIAIFLVGMDRTIVATAT